ncbi:MAG: DNA-processing protein DprA [Bacteroidota bacterium]
MSQELASWIALELIPGIGNRAVKQLVSYCGSAADVFKAPKQKLKKIPGFGDKMVDNLLRASEMSEANEILEKSNLLGTEILHFGSSNYPKLLKQAPDAPNLLFKRGSGDVSPDRSVAIVGTRKATEYGKRITEQIVDALSSLNVSVISGLAYGIDIQAHKACLSSNVPTIGVLAGGIDRIYPSVHKKYAEEMLQNGALLTESFPGTRPDRHLFPARNRIIAGMTDATIIVEAAEKGGALITANIADSYNRPVFAVPGSIGQTYSEGCNRLIATQRALIYTGIEDLIYQLGWDTDGTTKKEMVLPSLTSDEKTIYKLLNQSNEPLEIDLIAIKSQIAINQVASLLLALEFKNLVKSMPGKKFGLR